MGADLEDLLRMLRENAEAAKDICVELTDDYLAMIEYVESLPQNQSGADKGTRWIGSWPEAEASLRNVRMLSRRP